MAGMPRGGVNPRRAASTMPYNTAANLLLNQLGGLSQPQDALLTGRLLANTTGGPYISFRSGLRRR